MSKSIIKELNTFKKVVVLMLENRSFDNLLGYLYEDGVPHGQQFEGLQTGDYSCPVPARAVDYARNKVVKAHEATDLHQPYPDPGEFYAHVNTQLYNHIDSVNVSVDGINMKSPYNQPSPLPTRPSMDGFVNDYINTLETLEKRDKSKIYPNKPHLADYGVIMQCFKPSQVPALSTLAKEFAVFDHWHSSVPSQTWSNRAFWHSATSTGFVVNPALEGQGVRKTAIGMNQWVNDFGDGHQNLFTRMKDRNHAATVYSDFMTPLTTLIYPKSKNAFTWHKTISDFQRDAKNGELPDYSFIEPNFMAVQHDDMHPSSVKKGKTEIGTVALGDQLIAKIYNAIFTSEKSKDDTLLIITADEHGGCFDHVAPPFAASTSDFFYDPMVIDKDTKPATLKRNHSFKFDRLGVRVPMVMVSAHIKKNTIMNEVYDHTSFIKTMSKRWGLESLTARDKAAKSFEAVFSKQKRTDFPDLSSIANADLSSNEQDVGSNPLNGLQRSILAAADYLARQHENADANLAGLSQADEIETIEEAQVHLEALSPYLQ